MKSNTVVVLDFGSQYTQLIARRIREQKVFSLILPYNAPLGEILSHRPKALIFSGSPANVYGPSAPLPDAGIFETGLPMLGICYELHLVLHLLKGKVKRSEKRE